jgi:hypothetical protein
MENRYLEKLAGESWRDPIRRRNAGKGDRFSLIETVGGKTRVDDSNKAFRKILDLDKVKAPLAEEVSGAAKVHPIPKPGVFKRMLHHPASPYVAAGLAGAGLGAYAVYSSSKKSPARKKNDNKYLIKAAQLLSPEGKKDLANTATIALAGGVTTSLADRVLHAGSKFNAKTFAVGTGLGLLGDYAALRVNKAENKYIDKLD